MSIKEVSKPNRNLSQDLRNKHAAPNKSMESNKRGPRMRENESKAKEEQKLHQDSHPKPSNKALNLSDSRESPNFKDFIKKNILSLHKSKKDIDLDDTKINKLMLEFEGIDLAESCIPVDEIEVPKTVYREMENCSSFGNINNSHTLKAMEDIQQKKECRNSSVNRLRNDKEHASLTELLSPSKPALGKRLIERAKESIGLGDKSKGKNNRFSADTTEIILEKAPPKRSSSKANEGRNPLELTLSLRSQQVLTNKFIKEFNNSIETSEINSEKLDLNSVIAILQQLNFIKNDPSGNKFEEETMLVLKLWKLSKCENFIAKSHFLATCLHIMNLPLPEGSEQDVYSVEEALQIHKTMFPLYQNKQLMVTQKKKKVEKDKALEECSFKPKINEDSKYMASEKKRRFGSVGSQLRDEYFEWKNSRFEEKRKQIKQEKEEMEIEECTFKPVIFSRSFSKPKNKEDSRSRTINNKSNVTKEEPSFSNELKISGAFSENIILTPNEKKANNPEKIPEPSRKFNSHESIQKEIERLRKARELKQKKKSVTESPQGKKPQIVDKDSKFISPSKSPAPRTKNQGTFRSVDKITQLPSEINIEYTQKSDNTELDEKREQITSEENQHIGENHNEAVNKIDSESLKNTEKKEDIEIISSNQYITVDEIVESSESNITRSELVENKEPGHDSSLHDKEFALENFIIEHFIPNEAAEKLRNILKLT